MSATIDRYRCILRSSADHGYVVGIFDQRTGKCLQDDEGFDEVAELNRLYEENQKLKRSAKKAVKNLKELTKLALDYQKRALGVSLEVVK